MNRYRLFIILSAISLFLASCSQKKPMPAVVLDGFTQGSTFHMVIRGDVPEDISRQIDSILTAVDNSMSVFNPDSQISRINRGESDSVDIYIKECIMIAEKISEESDGLYDITIKPLTGAYGFAGDKAIERANVDSLLQLVGYRKISIEGDRLVRQNPGMQIDLNSIAQGYTTDIISRHLESIGIENYLVEVGGEIFSRGKNRSEEDWSVGIDKPIEGNASGQELQEIITLSGKGLATSGNYRKFYTDDSGRKIVHTINPKTGEPVISNLLSVTVVAENATLADVYGTFFMVAGLEKTIDFLNKHRELDAYMIYSDDEGNLKTIWTSGLAIKK